MAVYYIIVQVVQIARKVLRERKLGQASFDVCWCRWRGARSGKNREMEPLFVNLASFFVSQRHVESS